nr:Endo-N-acetylneuraminidase [uncultured Mediterranean phage uvMED]BAR24835.1 Endo-N-acetylneuraminidase [uncultured Mediterranean phage uvMED]
MAQADGVVANGSGSAVRADINAQLAAAFTNHSGATQPATTYAYQNWTDTSSGTLKIRNSANSGYISLRSTDGKVIVPDGTASLPGIYFSNNVDVGIFRSTLAGTPATGALAFTLDGVAHAIFGRTLESQTNAFVFGPAAYRATALNPSNGNNDATVAGVCIANDGPVHIGSYAERPVTINMMNTTGKLVLFRKDGQEVGDIRTDGTGISTISQSDYRLKENIVSLTGSKDRLNSLVPCKFNFITQPDKTVDGFIAHEVESAVPEAVFGVRDAVDSDGNPDYQGLDTTKLIPLLTSALQEAFAEIAALRTRVETLEAG